MENVIFDTFSDFLSSKGVEIKQEIDFTIHSSEEIKLNLPLDSGLYRANYYTLMIVKKGIGHHHIDQHCFPFSPNSIYFTPPGCIRSFVMKEVWEGYVVTFTASFLKIFGNVNGVNEFPFLINNSLRQLQLSEEEFDWFFSFCKGLCGAYINNPPNPEKLFSHYILIILLKINEYIKQYKVSLKDENSSEYVVMEFRRLLNHNFEAIYRAKEDHIWKVSEFADRLNFETNYFGQVIKSKTGQSVKAFIHHKIITEAKSLLINTTLNISEIATILTFSETTNFNRFFKNQVQLTPRQYRELKN